MRVLIVGQDAEVQAGEFSDSASACAECERRDYSEMLPWAWQVARNANQEVVHVHFVEPNGMLAKARVLEAWAKWAFGEAARKYGCVRCLGCGGPVVTYPHAKCGACDAVPVTGLNEAYPLAEVQAERPLTLGERVQKRIKAAGAGLAEWDGEQAPPPTPTLGNAATDPAGKGGAAP